MPQSVPSANGLSGFAGTWDVRRKIIDRLNSCVLTFAGQALISPEHFEEHGETSYGLATLQSSRTYRLRPEDNEVAVCFPDFREFVSIGQAASQRLAHRCGADEYSGRLFFRNPDAWAEMWHVKGPRKHYLSLAHYRRAR